MARITRPELGTRSGPCIECQKKTRSHELEPAEYEEYRQEVVVKRSDEFSNNKWEDVEEEIRSEIAIEPVVMCHGCWVIRQNRFANKISTNYNGWNEDVISNSALIRKAMSTLQYYDFENKETIQKIKSLVKKLKGVAFNG
jgi:hypothetical protein